MPNIDAETRDKLSPVWDMSQERAFMESLFNQRLSFFLIFFSIVIAGALNTQKLWHLIIILCLGSIICWLLASTIYRAQKQWNLLMRELYKDMTHPATIINEAVKGRSSRPVLGFWIPTLCSSLLTLGFILSLIGVIDVNPSDQSRLLSNHEQSIQQIRTQMLYYEREVDSLRLEIERLRKIQENPSRAGRTERK